MCQGWVHLTHFPNLNPYKGNNTVLRVLVPNNGAATEVCN